MINKKMTIRRITEMFIGSVSLSVLVCILCTSGAMPVESLQRDITLAALPIIYIVWNFRCLRRCYLEIGKEAQHYILNLIATAVFAATSIATYITASMIFSSIVLRKAYSWVFLVTYLFGFSNLGIPSISSIALFHIVLFVSVFLAPIGLGWVKEAEEEQQELLERVPGILEVNPLEHKQADMEVTNNESKDEEEKSALS